MQSTFRIDFPLMLELRRTRKVNARLPGKVNSSSHGAAPVHLITTMMKWILTSKLSIKISLSTLSLLSARWTSEVWSPPKSAGYVTKFAPHKALKSIA